MMIVKPDFYDKFICIAKDCDFTCCQEWKIAVDDDTADKWKQTQTPEGTKSRRKRLEQFTQYKDGTRVISLENHVCPFLNEDKLCRLVMQYGDEMLSETCQVFPREKHEFGERVEHTLMPCCPAVVDLLNESKKFSLIESGLEHQNNLLFRIRGLLMEIVEDENMSCEEAMLVVFYIASEFHRDANLTVECARGAIGQILDTIKGMSFDKIETYNECYELFLDLTENYCREGMYSQYLEAAMNDVRELENADCYDDEFEQEWDRFQPLFHKFLAQEIYADTVNRDYEISDMVIRTQWIGLEYALIRHLCFIYFKTKGKLEYQQVRSYIVLVSRMMGYEEDDIYEYLENCFEEMVWEWGYFALVIGK